MTSNRVWRCSHWTKHVEWYKIRARELSDNNSHLEEENEEGGNRNIDKKCLQKLKDKIIDFQSILRSQINVS